jgi:hypothetical protein
LIDSENSHLRINPLGLEPTPEYASGEQGVLLTQPDIFRCETKVPIAPEPAHASGFNPLFGRLVLILLGSNVWRTVLGEIYGDSMR